MPENFELTFNEKTFVLKKMNPARKALVINKVIIPWNKSKELEGTENQLAQMAEASAVVPSVIWDFIKDEDKQHIGTQEKFTDEIESGICDQFVIWAMQQIKASNDFFLSEAQKAAESQE